MTADEYAKRVQALVLSAGCRRMEADYPYKPSAQSGLFQLAMGAADAVRGKGREHERDSDTQAFEQDGARPEDWLCEARDELTDCAAWITGADEISRSDRAMYRDAVIWHLACALDALDSWMIFERSAYYMGRGSVKNPVRHEDTTA